MSKGELELSVDRARCQGSRACTRRAPRTFGVGPDGKACVLDPRGDPEPVIVAAVHACPTFALSARRDGHDVS